MAVTVATFKMLFPEFSPVPPARALMFVQMAERRVNRTAWGSRADDGVHYMTAHLLTNADARGSAAPGPVQSEQVGDISVSYGVSLVAARRELATTSYGRTFLELEALVFACRLL